MKDPMADATGAWRQVVATFIHITLFSSAMGYLEAVCVVYLRSILTRRPDWPTIEVTRELATLVILTAFAVSCGRNWRERGGVFIWIFGVWDIVYYLGLYLWLQWPETLMTVDTLFYIPCVWAAPVYVPVVFSLVLMAVGALMITNGATPILRRSFIWIPAGCLFGIGWGSSVAWAQGEAICESAMGMSIYMGIMTVGVGLSRALTKHTRWALLPTLLRVVAIGTAVGALAAMGRRMFFSDAVPWTSSVIVGIALSLAPLLLARDHNY